MNFRIVIIRIGTLLGWIGIAVVSAVLYGIINNQITATISPEYFTVFKRHQFASMLEQFGVLNTQMRVQAVFIGILSTWWFGLFLGIVLSICGMVGRYAPLSIKHYIHAVVRVMISTLCISVIFCVVAYIVEPLIKPHAVQSSFLHGIKGIHRAYCVAWWHNGAYLGALISTLSEGIRVQKERKIGFYDKLI